MENRDDIIRKQMKEISDLINANLLRMAEEQRAKAAILQRCGKGNIVLFPDPKKKDGA